MEDWTTILIVAVGILFSFFKAKYKDGNESDFEEEKTFEEKPVVKSLQGRQPQRHRVHSSNKMLFKKTMKQKPLQYLHRWSNQP